MLYKTLFINEMYFLIGIFIQLLLERLFCNVEKSVWYFINYFRMNDSSDIIKCPIGFSKTLYLIQVSNIVLSLKLQLSSLFVYGFAQSHHFKKEQIICLEFGWVYHLSFLWQLWEQVMLLEKATLVTQNYTKKITNNLFLIL